MWSGSRASDCPTTVLSSQMLKKSFSRTESLHHAHCYTRLDHQAGVVSIDELARWLADRIMCYRCRGWTTGYLAWRRKIDTGQNPKKTVTTTLCDGFVHGAFGLPGERPAVPKNHLQGLVAQYLWYFTMLEIPIAEPLEDIRPMGTRAIDHGSDGLTLHRTDSGDLRFRLWEIKKVTRKARVNATIDRACRQLNTRAMEYLAEHTPVAQELNKSDPEKAKLYGQMCELWLEGSQKASAGIAIATCIDRVPKRGLTDIGKRMPKFKKPLRLHGILQVLENFEKFATKVQQEIWKGL